MAVLDWRRVCCPVDSAHHALRVAADLCRRLGNAECPVLTIRVT